MQQEIIFRDQASITIHWFKAEQNTKLVALCLPAMGVRASYYHHFAQALQATGVTTITADWRGHGTSSGRASRQVDFGYETLVEDLHQLVQEIRSSLKPSQSLVVIGHSLGGQIASLCSAKYAQDIDGIVLLAACLVYYKGWDGWRAHRVRLAGHLFYPLSRLVGYFPGQVIGFGGREARTVMYDWCYNLLYGKYRPAGSLFDYEAALSRVQLPILALSLENDDFAPKRAVQNLCQKFVENEQIVHQHVSVTQSGIAGNPHFSWAKQPQQLIALISDWMAGLPQ